jgi:hypothetical protein
MICFGCVEAEDQVSSLVTAARKATCQPFTLGNLSSVGWLVVESSHFFNLFFFFFFFFSAHII